MICTVDGDGKSAGAVYKPPDVIVPSVAFPPDTPLTLQLTPVSVVFVTVAAKVAWPPSTTDPFAGVTLTCIVGEGGGGGDAPPAPQPNVHAPAAITEMSTTAVVLNVLPFLGERDRMPSQKQAKGQRIEKGIGVSD